MSETPRWELYSRCARVVIDRSVVEAKRLGSPVVTELHLVLGTLFEDGKLSVTRRILERLGAQPEKIYAEVDATTIAETQDARELGTTERVGLSELALQVLLQAEKVADRLDNRYIGSEHIFMGLLQDELSLGSQIFIPHGISRRQFWDEVVKLQDSNPPYDID